MDQDSIFQSASFWSAVSFVIFILLAWWKGRQAITTIIDGRIERIRTELEEVERLKDEAQAQLAEIKKRQRNADKEAEKIRQQAQQDAERIQADAMAKLEIVLKRHEQQAQEKIVRLEEQARKNIQSLAADRAITLARHVLEAKMSGKEGARIIEEAIEDLPRKLN